MDSLKSETKLLRTTEDVVTLRQELRVWLVEYQFSLVDQTKMITASSELARNTVIYGGGGQAQFEILTDIDRIGMRVIFEDKGPGIADIERALTDGFTSGSSLGLGLGGARRLVNEFTIDSTPGEGTSVSITRWRII